jgi:hypothetical protein
MAFGISRAELNSWKEQVLRGEIAYLTHYWLHPRYPGITTVTKVGCSNLDQLHHWCISYGLPTDRIHLRDKFPHFDLIGPKQKEILSKEGLVDQIQRFRL